MSSTPGMLLYVRCFRFVWNKKFETVFGGLSLVFIIHMLYDVSISQGHIAARAFWTKNSSSIPKAHSLHSRMKFEDIAKTDFSRIDDYPVVTGRHKKKIIVMSYMRSGSTLVGDIIQSHPDVFYVYEPLLYLWDYYVPKKMNAALNLWHRTKTFWKSSNTPVVPPLEFMSYMFRCNLTANNLKFLTNAAHSQVFRSARCPITRAGMNIVNTSDFCVHRLTKRCSSADYILLKVVRLSMVEADEFLTKYPDVKIIHLVRDPRGILLSRMHFNNKETGEMHNNYSSICKRIYKDVQFSQTISYKHRGKILTIRYEDLAQNLEGLSKKLFEFVDLSLHPEVVQHLKEITSSEDVLHNGKTKAKKTRRRNPYKTAYKWRDEMPFSLVEKVDQECKDLYKVMGYRSFSSEADLRNFEVPARSQLYGKRLITASLG